MLSPRERDVVRLIACAHSDKQIAFALGLSVNTVRSYVREVAGGLGISTRAELTRWAMQHPEARRGELASRATHELDPDCICPFCIAMAS
jgi:DNA-binding NarL/FixJ family response regulator